MRALIFLALSLAAAGLANAAPIPGIEPALPAEVCRAANTVGGMADKQYDQGLLMAERALEPLYGFEALEPLYRSLEPLYGSIQRGLATIGGPGNLTDRACDPNNPS